MTPVSRYLDPPLLERLNHLQLTARRVAEGATTGPHRSPFKGASVDFRQHRFYTAGDDPRRLDWRVLARTNRPYVKEYDQETNLRCLILLDRSGSMAYPLPPRGSPMDNAASEGSTQKFAFAERLSAALAYVLLARAESTGLATFASNLDTFLPPRSSPTQLGRILDALDRTGPGESSDVARSIHSAADRLGRRALVIIVSDFLAPADKIRQALARLRHDHHETLLLRVLHPDELTFPFHRWTRFSGLEAESARTLEPAVQRSVYLQNFNIHREQLRSAALTTGASLTTLSTDQDIGDALAALFTTNNKPQTTNHP